MSPQNLYYPINHEICLSIPPTRNVLGRFAAFLIQICSEEGQGRAGLATQPIPAPLIFNVSSVLQNWQIIHHLQIEEKSLFLLVIFH